MPTSRTVRDLRAEIVHQLALEHGATTLDDLAAIPRLAGWTPRILDVAVADLVADGRFRDDARGRLVVAPLEATR